MSTGLFLVVRVRDRWWIDFEGRAFGPLDTRDEAVVKAHDLAEAARRFGRAAEVMAPDEDEQHWLATPKPPAPSRRVTPVGAEAAESAPAKGRTGRRKVANR